MSVTLERSVNYAMGNLPFFVNSFMFEGERVAFSVGTSANDEKEAGRLCAMLMMMLELESGQLIIDVKNVIAGTPSLVPPSPERLIKFCMLSAMGFDVSPKVLATGHLLVNFTDENSDAASTDTVYSEPMFIKALDEYAAEFGPFSDYVSRLWQSGDI